MMRWVSLNFVYSDSKSLTHKRRIVGGPENRDDDKGGCEAGGGRNKKKIGVLARPEGLCSKSIKNLFGIRMHVNEFVYTSAVSSFFSIITLSTGRSKRQKQ